MATDIFSAEEMEDVVLRALGGYPYRINTWIDLNQNLFTWMKLEKIGMGLILLLIVLIAAFVRLAEPKPVMLSI